MFSLKNYLSGDGSGRNEPEESVYSYYFEEPVLNNYVDKDGMYRVYQFSSQFCPSDGDRSSERLFSLSILDSCIGKHYCQDYYYDDGNSSRQPNKLFNDLRERRHLEQNSNVVDDYQTAESNPSLSFNYPQLSVFYSSYEEYLCFPAQYHHHEEFLRQQEMTQDFCPPSYL